MEKGCPFIGFKPCVEDRCYFYFDPDHVKFSVDGELKEAVFPGLRPPCSLYFAGIQAIEDKCAKLSLAECIR